MALIYQYFNTILYYLVCYITKTLNIPVYDHFTTITVIFVRYTVTSYVIALFLQSIINDKRS
jgi:hypothetical protein